MVEQKEHRLEGLLGYRRKIRPLGKEPSACEADAILHMGFLPWASRGAEVCGNTPLFVIDILDAVIERPCGHWKAFLYEVHG